MAKLSNQSSNQSPTSSLAIAKSAGFTTFANIALAAAQWLLLIIIVKQFDELILGQLVLSLSLASPLFLLFSFKIRSLIVIDYHNQRTFEQYLAARWSAQLVVVM